MGGGAARPSALLVLVLALLLLLLPSTSAIQSVALSTPASWSPSKQTVSPFGLSTEPEQQQQGTRTLSDFSTRDSRIGFVRKVYSIFTVQMLSTIAVTAAIIQNDGLRYLLYSNYGVIGAVSALGSVAAALALVASKWLRHTAPINYILLGTYTFLQSLLVGTFASLMDPRIVCAGTMHTLTAFVALTAWTFLNPQRDLTTLGSSVLTLATTASLGLVLGQFFRIPLLDNLGSMLMAVVLSVYVAHDTAKIVGGEHRKHAYGPKDFILAALSLYQDVVALFLRIVEILYRMQQYKDQRNRRFSRQ